MRKENKNKHTLQFKQEISEKEYSMLIEDEKRFYQRDLTRKGLRYREDILDNMGSDELIS